MKSPLLETVSALFARFGIDEFVHPDRAAWLLVLAAISWIALTRTRPASLPIAGFAQARLAGLEGFDVRRALGLCTRAGALVALALVLGKPVGVHRAPPEPGHGLDLVLVVDASESMNALDAHVDGAWRTRLELARSVVTRFAERRAAEGDRVALVVFGESAFTSCPLTSDGALLASALERLTPGIAGSATALGDALALAVKRVAGAGIPGTSAMTELATPLPGRVAVLLTDGRSNAGEVPLEVAAALARSTGVRVHTVGIGSAGEEVPMRVSGDAARGVRFERHDVDHEALERLAGATGGRAFRAGRSGDLAAVYAEIDGLERVSRNLPPRVRRSDRPEPLLALAGGFLLIEIATTRVFGRRLP